MPQNQFKIFAAGNNANTYDPTTYASMPALQSGVSVGTADPKLANTSWRQSSHVAAMIGMFINVRAGVDALDDGNVPELEANFEAAIQSIANAGISNTTIKTIATARTQLFSSRTPGTYTVTVPAGVTRIFIPGIWGGGGGGGYNSGGGAPSGGASGSFNCDPAGSGIAVNPGDTLTVVIGTGGLGGAASPARAGQPGGDTYILVNGTEVMRAGGGAGGLNGTSSGGVANSPSGGVATGGDANHRQGGTPGCYGALVGGAIFGGDGAGAPGPGGGTYVRGGQGSPASGAAPGGGGSGAGNASYGGGPGAPGGADIYY